MNGAGIVGRGPELELLDTLLLAPDAGPAAVVVEGPAGIGKTLLLETVAASARERGVRVLAAAPPEEETRFAYAALGDLLEGLDLDSVDLPEPQRRALDAALLVRDDAEPSSERAVAAGLLAVLRTHAADTRLLVVVDDVQWLDEPSADALAFAARRLRTEPVGFLVARRPSGTTSVVERALARTQPLERLPLEPLSIGAIRRLLYERLGMALPRRALHRVVEAAGGNPLFALELGRMLARDDSRDDVALPASLEAVLGERVAALGPGARRALLAVALNGGSRVEELAAIGLADALDEAVEADVVVSAGGRVRSAHPLLGVAAKAHSNPPERRDLHRRFAETLADPERRALHLALATEGEDAAVAATIAEAAAHAARRFAFAVAAQLAEHALRTTPVNSPDRDRRLLDAAAFHQYAGDLERVTELLAPELPRLPSGATRARACYLLAGGVHSNADEVIAYLERALAESTDDLPLRSQVLMQMAFGHAAGLLRRLDEAEAWAAEAVRLAAGAGDETAEQEALASLLWVRNLRGRPTRSELRRARLLPERRLYHSSRRAEAVRLIWRGELPQARETLEELIAEAAERDEWEAHLALRLQLCELDLRAGDWGAVETLLDEWATARDEVPGSGAAYARCRALLALGVGWAEDAIRDATDAIATAEAFGNEWQRLAALRARGAAALLAGRPAEAVDDLAAVWQHLEQEGVREPGAIPVAPDLVEALAALGRVDAAREVAERLGGLADEQRHPWALAAAARSRAVVAAAGGDEADAIPLFDDAAARFDRLGRRFEHARTLLLAGPVLARLKRRRDARSALEQAAQIFTDLGSLGWSERTQAELARIGGRRASGNELTPTEERVARLVAAGRRNREVANELYVSVAAVEANLSRIYAKLGIRSRTELAARLGESAN